MQPWQLTLIYPCKVARSTPYEGGEASSYPDMSLNTFGTSGSSCRPRSLLLVTGSSLLSVVASDLSPVPQLRRAYVHLSLEMSVSSCAIYVRTYVCIAFHPEYLPLVAKPHGMWILSKDAGVFYKHYCQHQPIP